MKRSVIVDGTRHAVVFSLVDGTLGFEIDGSQWEPVAMGHACGYMGGIQAAAHRLGWRVARKLNT